MEKLLPPGDADASPLLAAVPGLPVLEAPAPSAPAAPAPLAPGEGVPAALGTNPPPPTAKQQQWGVVISIVVIVLMIVVGAFYSWGKRIAEERALIAPITAE